MDDRVSIRAHFERFPATVKGAFVLRAADRDPHQVRIAAARVREVSGRGSQPLDMAPITLDVAPNLDLFVPFEFPITELGAGWYGLECEVAIDGTLESVRPPKRFVVAWPRASVRRGAVKVGKTAQVRGGPKVRFEQIECGGDSIRVSYVSAPSVPAVVRLAADGAALPILEAQFDQETGHGRVTAYPLLRSQSRVAIEVRGAASPIEISLP
jgi:hypothetical protein